MTLSGTHSFHVDMGRVTDKDPSRLDDVESDTTSVTPLVVHTFAVQFAVILKHYSIQCRYRTPFHL